jgi:hypothetical protein
MSGSLVAVSMIVRLGSCSLEVSVVSGGGVLLQRDGQEAIFLTENEALMLGALLKEAGHASAKDRADQLSNAALAQVSEQHEVFVRSGLVSEEKAPVVPLRSIDGGKDLKGDDS